MAIKYYSDGTYTKGDGKLYAPGVGVVGNDKSTNVSKAESGTSTPTTNSKNTGITTMRGTGSGSSSSKSYTDTLKENITNSVNNPSNGVYSSVKNNSMIKDMQTAYNYANKNGGTTDNSIEAYLAQNGVNAGERYEPNYGDMGDELSYNPYEEAYRESQKRLQEMEEQIREQNRLAVEQGTNRLNAQKTNINQAADENARQAYVQYMQSQKALPQQLASQGVSGGATETANLGLQTAYQNNVNAINQNKANRLQEIDNAIVDLQNTGDLSTVEQVLANNQAALDAYMNTFDKGVGYNQWANQFNANRADTMADQAYRDQVYADNMAQQQWENDWFEKQYNDSKDSEEFERTIWAVENGLADTKLAAAKLGVAEDKLSAYLDYIKRARALELSNTQSLISNRNSGGSGGNGGYKTANKVDVFNSALAMLKDVDAQGWTADDIIRFVMGQGLSETDEMTVLQNLGLISEEPEYNEVETRTHSGVGRGF